MKLPLGFVLIEEEDDEKTEDSIRFRKEYIAPNFR